MTQQDDFFSELANVKPYLKIAFEGFAGSGKTFTAAELAIGLYRRIASTRPVVIYDTEEAAKFLAPIFKESGVPVVVKRSRSLADLKETMTRMRNGFSDVLVIDSISHVWEDFLRAYQAKVKRQRIEFQDWGIIKPAWKTEFSEPFVRDPFHVLMTGRAGYEYDNEKDEHGKRQLIKTGIKMKVEGETAYEPDILVLMERFEEVLTDKKAIWREATVIKDRSTLIDGKTFRNPRYEDFVPAIERIIADAAERGTVAERDAGELFRTEEDKREWVKQKQIALEEIEAYLVEVFPGQSAEAKKHKVAALKFAFETASWTAVTDMRPKTLVDGLSKIRDYVKHQINAAQSVTS